MPRKKPVKRSVKKRINKTVNKTVKSEGTQNLTRYQRAKNFLSSNKILQGTAGLVSIATIGFLINKYMKNGATREEAEKIASQETGVPVTEIKKESGSKGGPQSGTNGAFAGEPRIKPNPIEIKDPKFRKDEMERQRQDYGVEFEDPELEAKREKAKFSFLPPFLEKNKSSVKGLNQKTANEKFFDYLNKQFKNYTSSLKFLPTQQDQQKIEKVIEILNHLVQHEKDYILNLHSDNLDKIKGWIKNILNLDNNLDDINKNIDKIITDYGYYHQELRKGAFGKRKSFNRLKTLKTLQKHLRQLKSI